MNTLRNTIENRLNRIWQIIQYRPKMSIAIATSMVLFWVVRNYQRKLLYYPIINGEEKSPRFNPEPYQHPQQMKIASHDVVIKSEDGTILRGWHMVNPKSKRIIVYFHQNAGNIGTRLQFVKFLIQQTSSDVLLVAYRGFSDSQGTPTEKGIKKDAKAILKRALEIGQQKNLPVVVFGRSLGGGAAVYSCTDPLLVSRIKGVILENTFTSIHDVVVNMFPRPVTFLIKLGLWIVLTNRWNSYKLIPKIRKPVLFIKSKKDELIPIKQMDRLQEHCEVRSYEYLIPEGTHNESWSLNPRQYFKEVNLFLSRL